MAEAMTERLRGVVVADGELRLALTRPLRVREKVALAAAITLAYLRIRRALRRERLPELVARLRGDVCDSGAPAFERAAEHVAALRVARAVARLLPRLPGDTRCLTQSLIVTVLLARRGIGSKLVIAVVPGERLIAHAWVEHGRVPVLPTGDPRLRRLAEL